MGLIMQVKST